MVVPDREPRGGLSFGHHLEGDLFASFNYGVSFSPQ